MEIKIADIFTNDSTTSPTFTLTAVFCAMFQMSAITLLITNNKHVLSSREEARKQYHLCPVAEEEE